jgi:hypothetical protein
MSSIKKLDSPEKKTSLGGVRSILDLLFGGTKEVGIVIEYCAATEL